MKEDDIEEIIDNAYFRATYIVVVLVLLSFLAFKAGISLWVIKKFRPSTVKETKVIVKDKKELSPDEEDAVAEAEIQESLVSGRGTPDFWTITKELDDSRRENMITSNNINRFENDLLSDQLY